MPRLRPVSGHVRDTNAEQEEVPETEAGMGATILEWARQDSNLGPTDYESAALTAELRAPRGEGNADGGR